MAQISRRKLLRGLSGSITGLVAWWTTRDRAGSQSPAAATASATTTPSPDIPDGAWSITQSSIPDLGGRIFPGPGFVITNPRDGVYLAFSTRCTHDNCDVSLIRDEKIWCMCHGSQFRLDGRVARGPARRRLHRRSLGIRDGRIYVWDDSDD